MTMRRSERPLLLQAVTSGSGGGIEFLVRHLAESALERGWDSEVLFWRGEPPPGTRARYRRIKSGRLPTWAPRLWTTIRKLDPDIIHLHGPTSGSLGAVMARAGSRAPIVYTEQAEHRRRHLTMRLLRRLAGKVPTVNVALSRAVARSLVRDARVSARVVVIPTGVEPAVAALRGTTPTFSYVANLWRHKDHETLIRALAHPHLPRDVRVRLVGDGPERQRLEHMARHLSVSDRLDFLGYQERPWEAADGTMGYVHPTRKEGLGVAVIEAMMRGFPIAATRVGGIPELIRHGETGLLVRPGDPADLASAITRLVDDATLRDRLGRAARHEATHRFRLSTCLDSYFALYERLLSERVES